MLFIIHALDKPDHLELRKTNQPAHVEYVKSGNVKLVLAGPIFAADDPYNKAGLFERVDVNAWRKTVGWVD